MRCLTTIYNKQDAQKLHRYVVIYINFLYWCVYT